MAIQKLAALIFLTFLLGCGKDGSQSSTAIAVMYYGDIDKPVKELLIFDSTKSQAITTVCLPSNQRILFGVGTNEFQQIADHIRGTIELSPKCISSDNSKSLIIEFTGNKTQMGIITSDRVANIILDSIGKKANVRNRLDVLHTLMSIQAHFGQTNQTHTTASPIQTIAP